VRSHETHSGLDRHARPARPAISGPSNELLSNQVEGRLIATSGNFFTVADRSATVGPSALHLRHPAGMDDSARAHTGWDDIPYRRESHLETSTEARKRYGVREDLFGEPNMNRIGADDTVQALRFASLETHGPGCCG
jgi:hypothetical protein